jgi:hypothetical protein
MTGFWAWNVKLRMQDDGDEQPKPRPTWQCEFCGRFYSERTAKDHGYCIQEEDRRNAERAGAFDV